MMQPPIAEITAFIIFVYVIMALLVAHGWPLLFQLDPINVILLICNIVVLFCVVYW